MSNYVTTNIRISEEDYLRLKEEAARTRKSLSAVIRKKLQSKKKSTSKTRVNKLMKNLEKLAHQNAKYLKGIDGVKIIREMRDNAKW